MVSLLLPLFLGFGCAQTVKAGYREEVIERATDGPGRPEWVINPPDTPGYLTVITTSTSALSAEAGLRLAKAYALAQFAEQLQTSINVKSQLNTNNSSERVQEHISWQAAGILRSIKQKNVYWERRDTTEGPRYLVWALWTIPEKTFYKVQDDISQ